MSLHPETDAAWCAAKKESPSRDPYTDEELMKLRIAFNPHHCGASAGHAVIIWTLLSMLERQRGWKP